jgi:hypothetical protein
MFYSGSSSSNIYTTQVCKRRNIFLLNPTLYIYEARLSDLLGLFQIRFNSTEIVTARYVASSIVSPTERKKTKKGGDVTAVR